MKHSEIIAGEDYAVEQYTDSYRIARVVEVGTFTKTVYYGSRDYRGSVTKVKGARVVFFPYGGGEPSLTRIEQKRVYGEPESTFIDPYDGATVTTPATEDTFTEVEVDNTEWVASREVRTTRALFEASARRKNELAVANKKHEMEQRDVPVLRALLEARGVKSYVSDYATRLELPIATLVRLLSEPTEEVLTCSICGRTNRPTDHLEMDHSFQTVGAW